RRSLLFGLAGGLVIAGVTVGFTLLTGAIDPTWLIAPAAAAIAGIALFSYLGATQTNRTKAWVLERSRPQGESYPGDRFEKDPKAVGVGAGRRGFPRHDAAAHPDAVRRPRGAHDARPRGSQRPRGWCMMSAAAIEAENLTKTYRTGRHRSIEALRGLSFEVPAGSVFGLLGPNGAGKSTTTKILTTLSLPSSGTARVTG